MTRKRLYDFEIEDALKLVMGISDDDLSENDLESDEEQECDPLTDRDSLTEFLREQRYGQQSEPTRKKRRVNVEPGKSISTAEPSTSLANQNHENVNEPGESHASNQTSESRARSESK
uniref:Uncharacterized protein n=1 Tax=Heliothis virescens TaxID=7102 RepID=A0A2A4IWG1_HELVI